MIYRTLSLYCLLRVAPHRTNMGQGFHSRDAGDIALTLKVGSSRFGGKPSIDCGCDDCVWRVWRRVGCGAHRLREVGPERTWRRARIDPRRPFGGRHWP